VNRVLLSLSALGALCALALFVLACLGADPLDEHIWLFFVLFAAALVTSSSSQTRLAPLLRDKPLRELLTLKPMLPTWAARAVWSILLATALALVVPHVVYGSASPPGAFTFRVSAILFAFFAIDALVLLLVPIAGHASVRSDAA
jgi:hypothetical protein